MRRYALERDEAGDVTRMRWLGDVAPRRKPLPIGTTVKPYGRIAAILWTGGERYYHLLDKQGCVSMMPADVIEGLHDSHKPPVTRSLRPMRRSSR